MTRCWILDNSMNDRVAHGFSRGGATIERSGHASALRTAMRPNGITECQIHDILAQAHNRDPILERMDHPTRNRHGLIAAAHRHMPTLGVGMAPENEKNPAIAGRARYIDSCLRFERVARDRHCSQSSGTRKHRVASTQWHVGHRVTGTRWRGLTSRRRRSCRRRRVRFRRPGRRGLRCRGPSCRLRSPGCR